MLRTQIATTQPYATPCGRSMTGSTGALRCGIQQRQAIVSPLTMIRRRHFCGIGSQQRLTISPY